MADEDRLAEILHSCLEAVQKDGATVEQVLTGYPDQADALRPLLEAAVWFSTQKAAVNPRPGFVSASRARLLERIQQEQARQPALLAWLKSAFSLRRATPRLAFQFVIILVTLICLVMGSSGIAYAAQESIPGDRLYPVKLGLEQAEIWGTLNTAGDIRLYMAFSQRRLIEVQDLVIEGRYNYIRETVTRYEEQVHQATRLLTRLARANPELARQLAIEVEQTLNKQVGLIGFLSALVPGEVQPELMRAMLIAQGGEAASQAVVASTSESLPTSTPLAEEGTPTAGEAGTSATPANSPTLALTPTQTPLASPTASPSPTPTAPLTPTSTATFRPTSTPTSSGSVSKGDKSPTPTPRPTSTPAPSKTKKPLPNPTRRPPKP